LAEKIVIFDSKTKLIKKKIHHNIGFWEKRQFFSPKIGKNRSKLQS
jgi:hypothetical protein